MGDFFKETAKEAEKKEEVKLIASFEELYDTYDNLKKRSKQQITQAYSVIVPIGRKVMGIPPKEPGSIDLWRQELMKERRMMKIDVVEHAYDIIDEAEELIEWYERHVRFLEDYIDNGFVILMDSSIRMIYDLQKKLDEAQSDVERIKLELIEVKKEAAEGYIQPLGNRAHLIEPHEPPRMPDKEIEELRDAFQKKYEYFYTIRNQGRPSISARNSIMLLGNTPERKELITKWFKDLEAQYFAEIERLKKEE